MDMFKKSWNPLAIISLMAFSALAFGPMSPSIAWAESGQKGQMTHGFLLPSEWVILGTVQDIKSDEIQVNIGYLEPLFLSVKAAADKGITSIKRGDKLKVVVNDQNEFVDFHEADYPGWDRVFKGHLLQPLSLGNKWAAIQAKNGANETYEVEVDARITVMNIPVGVPALFLLNKDNLLVDATFGDEGELLDTLVQWSKERQRVVHY